MRIITESHYELLPVSFIDPVMCVFRERMNREIVKLMDISQPLLGVNYVSAPRFRNQE